MPTRARAYRGQKGYKMKITKQFLIENGACYSGKDAFAKVYGETAELSDIAKLAEETGGEYLGFALWLIVRCMTHAQKVRFAVFAAEKVIHIYEEKYPNDKRPMEAIDAAKKWIEKTVSSAYPYAAAAADAAYAAAAAADAAYADAAYAAYAAAADAAYAAYAAAAAADAAYADAAYAAYAAAAAADAASDIKKKCLAFGLKLTEENS